MYCPVPAFFSFSPDTSRTAGPRGGQRGGIVIRSSNQIHTTPSPDRRDVPATDIPMILWVDTHAADNIEGEIFGFLTMAARYVIFGSKGDKRLQEGQMSSLTRREWLLLVLREKPLDRIHLMKALFLIWHRSGQKIDGFFEFVPYMYGPCSFDLYRELAAAEKERLIAQAPHVPSHWASYFLTAKGKRTADAVAGRATQDRLRHIQAVVTEIAPLGLNDLLQVVYSEAPEFATKSVLAR